MKFRPVITLSAIFYVILRSIKDVFFIRHRSGHTFFTPLFLIPFFCINFSQTLGDLNQDELINIHDLLREVHIILEVLPEPTAEELLIADLNVNQFVNITDLIIMLDIILGNLDEYCTNDQWDIPCENNYSECCYPITSSEFTW